MSDCEYCQQEMGSPICGDEIQTSHVRFVCTRPPGHEGDHVACGVHHNLGNWHYDAGEALPTGESHGN